MDLTVEQGRVVGVVHAEIWIASGRELYSGLYAVAEVSAGGDRHLAEEREVLSDEIFDSKVLCEHADAVLKPDRCGGARALADDVEVAQLLLDAAERGHLEGLNPRAFRANDGQQIDCRLKKVAPRHEADPRVEVLGYEPHGHGRLRIDAPPRNGRCAARASGFVALVVEGACEEAAELEPSIEGADGTIRADGNVGSKGSSPSLRNGTRP